MAYMQETRITDDLEGLLDVLPPFVVTQLRSTGHFADLIEIVMDLGRVPEIRFASAVGSDSENETTVLLDGEVVREHLDQVLTGIGQFDADNRAGITRTLHRISAIKNRRGEVVGITCRVGRAVYGTIEIIADIIKSGKSVLLLGRPGVGKTTMLREAARVLAETRRVVIVDTSNEIGGDGDIAHPAVGRARRMQVAKPSLQHEVMIEAVENHNPQVIVIDEIGREQEAEAARTIAERGVQLIGTAHGQTLENLMQNPTLSDLVGGIESVTLGDDEARRRHTQKTVLERRAPPTFDVLVELQTRHKLVVHTVLADAVDALLRGRQPPTELRAVDAEGRLTMQKNAGAPGTEARGEPRRESFDGRRDHSEPRTAVRKATSEDQPLSEVFTIPLAGTGDSVAPPEEVFNSKFVDQRLRLMQVFPFGIPRNRLLQAVRHLGVPVEVVDSVDDADVVVTAKSYYRQRPRTITDAEHRNVPIYVLRSNSAVQMESVLASLFNIAPGDAAPTADAMTETATAIQRVLGGERTIDLSPQNQFVRRKQHELARESNLVSHSHGKEPYRHVRIFRE